MPVQVRLPAPLTENQMVNFIKAQFFATCHALVFTYGGLENRVSRSGDTDLCSFIRAILKGIIGIFLVTLFGILFAALPFNIGMWLFHDVSFMQLVDMIWFHAQPHDLNAHFVKLSIALYSAVAGVIVAIYGVLALLVYCDNHLTPEKAPKLWRHLNKFGKFVFDVFNKAANLFSRVFKKRKKIDIDETAESHAVKATTTDVIKAAFNKACIRVNVAKIAKG